MKNEHAKDVAAVERLSKDYADAWAKGDAELLLSCYSDDAVVIMSHEEPIVGKEALRELYEYVFASHRSVEEGGGQASMADAIGVNPEDYTWTTEGDGVKPEISGDMGYLWSTYANIATPKPGVDAKPISDSGVSLLIVKRQHDGVWKVALMMATRGEDPVAANEADEPAEQSLRVPRRFGFLRRQASSTRRCRAVVNDVSWPRAASRIV